MRFINHLKSNTMPWQMFRIFTLLMFSAPGMATAAVKFSTNFEDNVRNIAFERSDGKPIPFQRYLWQVSQDDMNDAFFTSLQALITQGIADDPTVTAQIDEEANEDVSFDIRGELTFGGSSTFIYTRITADLDSNREIENAYPSSVQVRGLNINDTKENIDRARAAIEYVPSNSTSGDDNWEDIRFSKPLYLSDNSLFNVANMLISVCSAQRIDFPDTSRPPNPTRAETSATQGTQDEGELKYNSTSIRICPTPNGIDYTTGVEFRIANFSSMAPNAKSGWNLHLFNVDSGNCGLLICEDRSEAVIFDCGRTTNKSDDVFTGKPLPVSRIGDLLEKYSTEQVDLVISHKDRDHVSLLKKIFELDAFENGGTELRNVFAGATKAEVRSISEYILKNAKGYVFLTPNKNAGEIQWRPLRVSRSQTSPLLLSGTYIGGLSSDTRENHNNWQAVKNFLQSGSLPTNLGLTNSVAPCGGIVELLAANETRRYLSDQDELDSQMQQLDAQRRDPLESRGDNTRSIVALIDGQVILTADATTTPLRRAVINAGNARPEFLTVPHHGSSRAQHFPEEWTSWVSSEHLIYQAGDQHGHPREESFVNPTSDMELSAPGFTGYEAKVTGNKASPSEVYFVNGSGNNTKRPRSTTKNVYITSEMGELMIAADGSIQCLGPFGSKGANNGMQRERSDGNGGFREPTYQELYATTEHCRPN